MRNSGDRWDRGFITFHAYVYAHMYAKCFLKSSVPSVHLSPLMTSYLLFKQASNYFFTAQITYYTISVINAKFIYTVNASFNYI